MSIRNFFLLLAVAIPLCGFKSGLKKGYLNVSANLEGYYEIYSIEGDASLQFVSEQLGQFNKDVELDPGQYLVLADCSHAIVVIHPGKRVQQTVHLLEFVPPQEPQSGDLFTVQCTRYERSHLRQQISNRFRFFVFPGAKDVLVGMVPLKIDLPKGDNQKPITKQFKLAAMRIAPWQELGEKEKSPFFVSPLDSLLSITQAQEFGMWQFLLPGQYQVSVNGTSKIVRLSEGEVLSLKPATLTIKTGTLKEAGWQSASPFYVEINEQHSLNPNAHYPILPGPVQIRLPQDSQGHKIELLEGEVNEIRLKSITVQLGCSPGEWECLGLRHAELFEGNEHYPFKTSATDVPIFYLQNKVTIGLVGSSGIRYKIPAESQDVVLRAGKVVLEPKPVFKQGQYTDLVRIEGADKNLEGFSADIPPDGPSTIPLIEGTYILARFTSFSSQDRERVDVKKTFTLLPFEEKHIEVPYYVSEARMKKFAKEYQARKEVEALKRAKQERSIKKMLMY